MTTPPRLPPPQPPLSKPHTNTLMASSVLTTTGSIAVSAFETQLMLYNRGLSLNLLHPTTSQHSHRDSPQGQKKCLFVFRKCFSLRFHAFQEYRTDTGPFTFPFLQFESFLLFFPSSLTLALVYFSLSSR